MEELGKKLWEERKELSSKIERLENFINSKDFFNIETIQQSLLHIQLKAMQTYEQCLFERIDNL